MRRFETDPDGIRELSKALQSDDVVLLEATTNAFWSCDQLVGLVKPCYILNTRKVTLQGNKANALDARRLVQLLSTPVLLGTEADLPTVWVSPVEIRDFRTLFSAYRSCKKVITQCKNRLHNLYRQHGIVFPRYRMSTAAKWTAVLSKQPLPGVLLIVSQGLVSQLEGFERQGRTIRHTILVKGMEHYGESVRLLMTIPGSSALSSIAAKINKSLNKAKKEDENGVLMSEDEWCTVLNRQDIRAYVEAVKKRAAGVIVNSCVAPGEAWERGMNRTETFRRDPAGNQSCLAKTGHQPEASLAGYWGDPDREA